MRRNSSAGIIAGGLITAASVAGLALAMSDRDTRSKIARSGNKIRHKAENAIDDFRDKH